MSADQWMAMLPMLIVTGTIVMVLMEAAFVRRPSVPSLTACAGLVAALVSVCMSDAASRPVVVTSLLVIDGFALYFFGLIFIASIATIILAMVYFKTLNDRHGEFYVLVLLAVLGSSVMAASRHFVSLFLGFEVLTVSLYGMIAYVRTDEHALEAGVKYLVLASVSTAFLLFGIALIYAELGTMDFPAAASALIAHVVPQETFVLYAGVGLTISGIGFKLGIVPFHMWTPDVYEGAPAPVTAFLATVSKGAMAAALLRLMNGIPIIAYPGLLASFLFVSIASMFVGNFLALKQRNVKRLLAYSSITHLGYLLVAFVASGSQGAAAVMYYLCAYIITSLAAFGIVSLCSTPALQLSTIDEYSGLFWTRPWLAAMFTASLLSLAGMPLTAGFIGKYLVISAGAARAQWVLLAMLAVNSAIGIYYYLRVVVAMYTAPDVSVRAAERMPLGGTLMLSVLTAGVVWLGVYPSPLMNLIHAASAWMP